MFLVTRKGLVFCNEGGEGVVFCNEGGACFL